MKTWKNKFQKVLAILLAICLVTGFMEVSQVQAATKKSGTTYYYTHLIRQKGGENRCERILLRYRNNESHM